MSANLPKISVLMTVHNGEKYLHESIQSILSQSFGGFEFLILDDGSTDGTKQILDKYCDQDKRIILIKNKQRLGIVKNRNKLLKLAKGEFIAWQDADDISLNLRLEKSLSFLQQNPEVGIVGNYREFFEDQQTVSVRTYPSEDNQVRQQIFNFLSIYVTGSMIRKSVFAKSGYYNERYDLAEDLDMLFKIGSNFRLANLPEVLYRCRINRESVTYKRLRELELNTLRIRFSNFFNSSYKLRIFDIVYNLIHLLSVFTVPPRIKIKLFSFLKDTRAKRPSYESVNQSSAPSARLESSERVLSSS